MQQHNVIKIGPGAWYALHLSAAHAKTTEDISSTLYLINLYRKNFFCTKCRDHFDINAEKYPPPTTNKNNELFEWTVMMHNKVNVSNGKPIIDAENALKYYIGESSSCEKGCEPEGMETVDTVESLIKDSISTNPKYYPKLKLGSVWE